MASFSGTASLSGGTEFTGKDVVFLKNTTDLSGASDFATAIQAVAVEASILVIGAPTASGCIVGVEGLRGSAPSGWAVTTISGVSFS